MRTIFEKKLSTCKKVNEFDELACAAFVLLNDEELISFRKIWGIQKEQYFDHLVKNIIDLLDSE